MGCYLSAFFFIGHSCFDASVSPSIAISSQVIGFLVKPACIAGVIDILLFILVKH